MSKKIQIVDITRKDEKRWNNLLFNSINASYRQSIPFEYAQELNGREIYTYIFQKNGVDIAGVHYSIKGAFVNFIKTADILSGFVFRKEPDHELVALLIDHFLNWAKKHKASFARIKTWLPKSIAGEETKYSSLLPEAIKYFGFMSIKPGRHTYWIDLTLSEEELLKRMKSQTRNKVRQGARSALIVKKHDVLNDEIIESFWSLYNNLGKLKAFHTLSKDRFEREIVSMVNHGLASLFFTQYEGQTVNVAVASNFGEANYYYGAISPEFKSIEGCPSPGPYSQWNMILSMKSKGLIIYDMGFCPGPIPIKGHPNYYIWRYKFDFGGDHVEFLPVYGKVLKPIRGRLFRYLRYKK